MATSRSKGHHFSFVEDGTLELESEAGYWYLCLVVTADLLMIIDRRKLKLHSRHDGKLLAASDKLECNPEGMCLVSNKEVAMFLENSIIEVLSFESTYRIERVKRFHVTTRFDACRSVAKVESTDKLVVSGRKRDDDYSGTKRDDNEVYMLYWCVVNLTDGRVESTHKICRVNSFYSYYVSSRLAVKNDTVYISCYAMKTSDTGVYSYHIPNPKRRKFLYRHRDLNFPTGLFMDTRDYIYVFNEFNPYSIHQLTERGELVTIHTLSSSPCAIFYEEQDGVLYITHKHHSNMVTRYRLEYPHQQGVPVEILNMDEKSIQLFEKALKDGKETIYHIRVMVVGNLGVGKTTLIKRLLGEEVNISERHSTEGIDVYLNCCDASLSTLEWIRRQKNSEQDDRLDRVVRVLNEQQSSRGKIADNDRVVIFPQEPTTVSNASVTDNEQVAVPPQGERALKSNVGAHAAFEDKDTELLDHRSPQQDHAHNLSATDSQQEELPSAIIQSESNTMPLLKLLQENPDKLKQDANAKAKLSIWDFAGQYAFYTIHQTFLTQRAIYLLVSDVSEQITALVADDCYLDSKGIRGCKVHELTDVWLNSIHSCASSPKSRTPPVILVGTHVDKLLQKQSSAKLVNLERQSTLPSTSRNAASVLEEEVMSSTFWGSQQESLQPPRKQPRLEVTIVTSMTGVHAIPSEDQLSKQRMLRLQSGREQQIVHTDVIEGRSAQKPDGEITVGADAGKVSRDEICKRYFRKIRSYLKDKPTRFHLVDEDFAIDNTVVDERLGDLKRKILEVASQQPYWGEEIPARWILLEQELMNQKADGVKVISFEEVENLNKKGTVQIEKSEELNLFLRYLHEMGIIIYFSIEVLRDNIVLDPIWLIDALKSLINAHPTLPERAAENGLQSTSPLDLTITQRWSDFKEKGILSIELIDAVWTQEKHPEFHAHKDHILLIMEQLNIIAKPRSFSEIGEKVEDYFLAPCMLRQECPREVISTRHGPRMVSTPVLQCIFRGKFLPSPIFHRLLAAFVARWPVAKKKETSEHLIFCGCCVFDLDLFHQLTLYCKNHVISARITRMAIDEVKVPDAKLCSRVKRFITLNLSKITSYLGQNLQYDLHVKSPPFEMWNADENLQFELRLQCPHSQMWLADEGHDPDAPITPEHMNHARLCVALETVCGNALRDILLTQVPAPHTDIYQAILANKINLTSRRQVRPGQWLNALLNQDQIQLVFPGNQGQRTGTVDQFDLSLLYILIRNVSTVAAPLTGWGNDTQDQPRDSSVGASVERIRSYRNHISGHSPDGKFSRHDFEDYWNKFESVLHDIEAATGRQVHIHELEKQKRQVITIHEAKITKHEQQVLDEGLPSGGAGSNLPIQEKHAKSCIPKKEAQNVERPIDDDKDKEPVPDEVAPNGGAEATPPIEGKLHQNVLNRCLPALVRNIDFQMVSVYMPQNKVIDEVHDLSEKKTESDKIRELIARIQEEDKDTYEEFKECLVKARQSYLKDMLEEHEKIETRRCTVNLSDSKVRSATKIEESDERSDKKGHVMISYSLAQKEKALWIKTQLENNGYSVWIDEENMHDSIADAMARAHVVLLCMSETYNSSVNCQKVALYRNGKRKVIIPLKMEDFTPHGFLESLVMDNIYYNFCGKSPSEVEMKKLLQELASYYIKDLEEPKIVPFDSTIVLDDGVPVTRAEATPHIQVETSVLSETIIFLTIENQDVKMTRNDLEEALAAGQDDARALHIVDFIMEQGDEKLKTWLLMHLSKLLTDKLDSVEKHANYRIWPGTYISQGETTFVCLYKNKFKTKLKSFFKVTILYKNIDELVPLIDYKNKEDLSWTIPTEEDALLIQSAIEEHGDRLFSEHSNLQVVCGGPFLLHERQQVVKKTPTIILYCHVKGIKPYGEKEFPPFLRFAGKDIQVDVREGYFALATSPKEWHDTLCMGISIGIKDDEIWRGTLGPFVDLGAGEKGFITCAHVVGTNNTDVVQPADGDLQGSKTDEERICGRVLKWFFNPGFLDRRNGRVKPVLVDAALVKLNKRACNRSAFPPIPRSDLIRLGLDPDRELRYAGSVYYPKSPRQLQGKHVIKYGRTTELRMGEVDFICAQVKTDNLLMKYSMWNDEVFIMKGLYAIGGIHGSVFAEEGDSGAGIFRIDEDDKLTLVGLVTGVLNAAHDHRCLATPIMFVLGVLNISRELEFTK